MLIVEFDLFLCSWSASTCLRLTQTKKLSL